MYNWGQHFVHLGSHTLWPCNHGHGRVSVDVSATWYIYELNAFELTHDSTHPFKFAIGVLIHEAAQAAHVHAPDVGNGQKGVNEVVESAACVCWSGACMYMLCCNWKLSRDNVECRLIVSLTVEMLSNALAITHATEHRI